jgi:ribulose kinase
MPSYKLEALFYHQQEISDRVEQAVRSALADLGVNYADIVAFRVSGGRDD